MHFSPSDEFNVSPPQAESGRDPRVQTGDAQAPGGTQKTPGHCIPTRQSIFSVTRTCVHVMRRSVCPGVDQRTTAKDICGCPSK